MFKKIIRFFDKLEDKVLECRFMRNVHLFHDGLRIETFLDALPEKRSIVLRLRTLLFVDAIKLVALNGLDLLR